MIDEYSMQVYQSIPQVFVMLVLEFLGIAFSLRMRLTKQIEGLIKQFRSFIP